MDKFVVETSTEEKYNAVNAYYNNKLRSSYHSAYGVETCISVTEDEYLGYANKGFYQMNAKEYGKILTFEEWQEKVGLKLPSTFSLITNNAVEHEQALKFYGKDASRFGTTKEGKCRLYIEDNKYNGWDAYKNNSYLSNKEVSFTEWAAVNLKSEVKSESKVNNMKYVVEVNNQAEVDAVNKVTGSTVGSSITTFPWCVGTDNTISGPTFFKKPTSLKQYGPVLTFKDWALMFGVELKPNKQLILTRDYTAEVNYNTKIVQVGCQSIPFATVEALAKLIKG